MCHLRGNSSSFEDSNNDIILNLNEMGVLIERISESDHVRVDDDNVINGGGCVQLDRCWSRGFNVVERSLLLLLH